MVRDAPRVAFTAAECSERCRSVGGGRRTTFSRGDVVSHCDRGIGVRRLQSGADLLQFFALVGPTLVNTGGGGLMNSSAEEVIGLFQAQVQAYTTAAAG